MQTAATLTTTTDTETFNLAAGELLISGYLTKWNELDRVGDRMLRGAFLRAIPAFLRGSAPLCVDHSKSKQVGRVLALEEDEIGVRMVAKVMKQPESSPLRYLYEMVKGGYMKSLSVGGFFGRTKPAPDGTFDIHTVDITECSLTSTPALPSTGFEVVAEGKALELGWGDAAAAQRRADLAELEAMVAGFKSVPGCAGVSIDDVHLAAARLRVDVHRIHRSDRERVREHAASLGFEV